MSEIEDDVAFALEQSAPAEVLGTLYSTAVDGDLYPMAEASIAAAEPHLRRKHRQELLEELITRAGDLAIFTDTRMEADYIGSLSDWLQGKEAE